MEEVWSGTGGRTTTNLQSSLKVEVGFDLKRGQLKGPFLLPGRRADLAGQLPAESFATGSLRIADLGYFSLSLNGQTRARRQFLVESAAVRIRYWLLLTANPCH